MMSESTNNQSMHGHHSHTHQHVPEKKYVHHSRRAGHNRTTKGQRKRAFCARVLCLVLSIIALIIIAIIAYDQWVGLF